MTYLNRKNYTYKDLSEILQSMLQTQNGKSPHFVEFITNLLQSLQVSNYELLALFHSSYIPEEVVLKMLSKDFTVTDVDLRIAWVHNRKSKSRKLEDFDEEIEWFFSFCKRLGYPYSTIIKMVHDLVS